MTILLLAVLAVAIASNMALSPRKGAVLLVALCLVQFAYFDRWEIFHMPKIFRWLPFLAGGVMALPLVIRLCTDRNALRMKSSSPIALYAVFVCSLLFCGAMSSLYNGISPVIGIFGLRYALFILLVSLVLVTFKCLPLDTNSFTRFIVFVGLAQIPFVTVQRIALGFMKIRIFVDNTDLTCGTLDDYTTLAFVELFAIGITLCHWLRTGKPPVGKNVFVLVGALYLPLLLSNSRAAFIFLAILLIVVAFRHRSHLTLGRIAAGALIVALLTAGALCIFWGLQKYDYKRDVMQQYSWKNIHDNLFKDSPDIGERLIVRDTRMGRGQAVVKAWELISRSPATLFLGLGPGNTQQSQVFGRNGRYFQSYGPLCGLSRHQLGLIIAETGLLGITLYLLLFLGIWRSIRKGGGQMTREERLAAEDMFLVFTTLVAVFSIYSLVLINYGIILFFAYMMALIHNQQTPLNIAT